MNKTVSVLIADDHELAREGLRVILESDGDFSVVGEAVDGAEAVQLAKDLHPDVVLMDLRMPEVDGIEAIRRIGAEKVSCAIVILTTFNEDELMYEGLRAGAVGYLLKDTDRDTLFETIRAAARGDALLKSDLLERLLARREDAAERDSRLKDPARLTDRELEVLAWTVRGKRNRQIARQLGISERTVKAHLARIYGKLGVDSRTAAVVKAVNNGLV